MAAALALPASAAAHTGIKSRSPAPGTTVSKSSITYVKVDFEGRISDATLVVKRNGTKVSRGDGSLAEPRPPGPRPPDLQALGPPLGHGPLAELRRPRPVQVLVLPDPLNHHDHR